MRTAIGAVAAILVGLALATGVTFAVSTTSAPDRNVNLEEPSEPDPWAGAIDYGKRTP